MLVGGVFLVDPHAFQRHRSSQTQRGWWWQTWSDTAEVLRKRLSPELHPTHTNRVWQWWFTRTNLWFTSWLCPFCDQMNLAACAQRQHNRPAQSTRWLHSKWIWRGKKHLYKRKLSQGRNNKDRLMTRPPRGRKDLDWCILSSWQSFCHCCMVEIKQEKLVLSVHLFILLHWNVCDATTVPWCQPVATKTLGDLEVIGRDGCSGFKPYLPFCESTSN